MAIRTSFDIPNSCAIWSVAGAIMEEDTGDMNVKAETMAVAAHFFLRDQLKNVHKELKGYKFKQKTNTRIDRRTS